MPPGKGTPFTEGVTSQAAGRGGNLANDRPGSAETGSEPMEGS